MRIFNKFNQSSNKCNKTIKHWSSEIWQKHTMIKIMQSKIWILRYIRIKYSRFWVTTEQARQARSQCWREWSNPLQESSKSSAWQISLTSDRNWECVRNTTLSMTSSQSKNTFDCLPLSGTWTATCWTSKSTNSSKMSIWSKRDNNMPRICQAGRKGDCQWQWHFQADRKWSYWMSPLRAWTRQPEDGFGRCSRITKTTES